VGLEAPKIKRELATGSNVLRPGDADTIIFLMESRDGSSLNADAKLIAINGFDDLVKLGQNRPGSVTIDTLQSFIDIGNTTFKIGRVTGSGGVKAQTAVISDFNATPAATLRAFWRGVGTDGNGFSLVIARGPKSSTDTGAGRVDTLVQLIETASGKVYGSFEGTMNQDDQYYLITNWNARGYLNTLTDQSLSDTYNNADEPAVGTYAFTGGTDPASATTTERQAAATVLAGLPESRFALIVTVDWDTGALNVLGAGAVENLWSIVNHFGDGQTPAGAKTIADAISSARQAFAMFTGWGWRYRNNRKRIPGVGQVAGLASLIGAQKSPNMVGANIAVDGWVSPGQNNAGDFIPPFDVPSKTDREAFAQARVNPLRWITGKRNGVIVGDVLSLSSDDRYSQWGMWRGENFIVRDVISYLENEVLLNPDYPFVLKDANGIEAGISLSTFAKVKAKIANLMKQYPSGLLPSSVEGEGWSWAGQTNPISGGFEVLFTLGLDIAGVPRVIRLRSDQVSARVAVLA
jgi:hypothetical protein